MPAQTASAESLNAEAKQLPASVMKILEGAVRAIDSQGAKRLSMSDISDASGVSRGTLYKYFSTKEEVLTAVCEFISQSFETGVREAAEQATEPLERFRSVMRYCARFTEERALRNLIENDPRFQLEFLRSHFERHKLALQAALAVTFDHVEAATGRTVDRDTVAEVLIRLQHSRLIIPSNQRWDLLWDALPKTVQRWLPELTSVPATRGKLTARERRSRK